MGNENSSLIETANDSFITASGYVCGSISDTFESPPRNNTNSQNHLSSQSRSQARAQRPSQRPSSPLVPSDLCASKAFRRSFSTGSLVSSSTYNTDEKGIGGGGAGSSNPTSALFARALMSEVHDNPNTMTASEMAAREKQLLQAQERALKNVSVSQFMKQINLWGGGGGGGEEVRAGKGGIMSRSYPPNQLHENRARLDSGSAQPVDVGRKHTVTIGLSLSRRHTIGHPDTVTRQTAFDFNELQDRAYKYVSSTDASGWRAGGGERGGVADGKASPMEETQAHKIASPDTVHIPIIQIDAESPAAVDSIIASLARGEIFIPHMSVLPEALSVNGVSPPDLIVRFGCERNDDLPPDEWPNWSLEFMHNQLYEYFAPLGARWMKRPFQITLAHKVRWRTVKHMNKYFAHAERVISAWREKGPQYLNPQLSYIEGGATPEEVARPHGIYLLRDGRPTNYFCPNLEPPYTTKMTRSLLLNVLDKSWDRKRRDWSAEPQQSLIAPTLLLGAMCGCDSTAVAGFMPNQTITPTNADVIEKQPACSIDSTPTTSKSGNIQPTRSRDSMDQSTPPRTKKKSSRKHSDNITSQVDSNKGRTSPQNHVSMPQPKAESPVSRYSPSSTETSPVVSEAGVSDIPERVSDIGDSSAVFSLMEETSTPIDPPKPEELGPPSAPIHPSTPPPNNNMEQKQTKKQLKEHLKASKAESSSEYSDNDSLADLPTNPPSGINNTPHFTSGSVGESQTTDPTSNSSTFLLAQEREQRKQREIEMLRERKKMEEIEAAIRRKRDRESREEPLVVEPSPVNKAQLQQPQQHQPQQRSQPLVKKQEKKQLKHKKDPPERHPSPRNNITTITTSHNKDTILSPPPLKISPQHHPPEQFENFFPTNFFNDTTNTIKSPKHLQPIQQQQPSSFNNNTQIQPQQQFSFSPHRNPRILRTTSADTLEYSIDTCSVSQNIPFDSQSVTTLNTNTGQSLLSYVTRSTMDSSYHHGSAHTKEEYYEPIPTDEELFTIGWAKALDAKSGSYYYFTLDRSRIVWENPLKNRSHMS